MPPREDKLFQRGQFLVEKGHIVLESTEFTVRNPFLARQTELHANFEEFVLNSLESLVCDSGDRLTQDLAQAGIELIDLPQEFDTKTVL
jgi:hypothetical protein